MKTIQLILKTLTVSFFFFLVVFISAGRIDYWQGWLYVSMNLLMTLTTVLASIGNTELMSERLKVIRTHLEDKTLINELTGYQEYTHKTPYRLIPKVW